jgi:hypothetical protein
MEDSTENESRPEIILMESSNSISIKNLDVQDELAFVILNDTEESDRLEKLQKMIHVGALGIKGSQCVVCEKPLRGTTYDCPTCGTRYCIRCAIELNQGIEACRTCKNELKF